MKRPLNHLLPYLEVLFLIACTGLWLSVPCKKKKMIHTCINKPVTQEKKALQLSYPLLNVIHWRCHLPLQLVYMYDIWNTRYGLSVMETNSSLKAVSLFLWLCIFLSDNHANWRLLSVSNFHVAQLCFPSMVSWIMKFLFCNYRYFCTTAWEILVPVLHFLPEF